MDQREIDNQRRLIRFYSALKRVRRTGSPAARADMRDARLDLEAHAQEVPVPTGEEEAEK